LLADAEAAAEDPFNLVAGRYFEIESPATAALEGGEALRQGVEIRPQRGENSTS
jgi:hypothetical protein